MNVIVKSVNHDDRKNTSQHPHSVNRAVLHCIDRQQLDNLVYLRTCGQFSAELLSSAGIPGMDDLEAERRRQRLAPVEVAS